MLWLKNMILQRDYKIDMIMREEKKKKRLSMHNEVMITTLLISSKIFRQKESNKTTKCH